MATTNTHPSAAAVRLAQALVNDAKKRGTREDPRIERIAQSAPRVAKAS